MKHFKIRNSDFFKIKNIFCLIMIVLWMGDIDGIVVHWIAMFPNSKKDLDEDPLTFLLWVNIANRFFTAYSYYIAYTQHISV